MGDSSLSLNIVANAGQAIGELARTEAALRNYERALRAAANAEVQTGSDAATAKLETLKQAIVAQTVERERLRAAVAASNAEIRASVNPLTEASAAHHGFQGATAGSTREVIVLAHEMLQGRFSRIPGSILVLGERMGGLHTLLSSIPAAAYAAGAGIAALAGGFALLAIRAHEAEAAAKTALAVAAGQNVVLPRTQAQADIAEVQKLAGVSAEDAGKIIANFAAMRSATAASINAMIKLLPDWAAGMRKEPVQASEEMAHIFDDLKGAGTKWLETINASAGSISAFQAALGKGDNASAFTLLLGQMAQYAQRVESQLHLVNQEAREAASIRLNTGPASSMIPGGRSGIPGQTSPAYDAAIAGIQQRWNQEQLDALSGASYKAFQQQQAQPKGADLDEVRQQIAAQQAQMELAGRTQAEIAQMEADTWQKRIAIGDLYGKELGTAQTELAHAQVSAQREGGQESIAAAREQISQLQAEGKLGATGMLQAEAGIWSRLLAGDKLTAQQRVEVQRDLNETLARLHGTEREEHLKALEAVTDAAKRGTQQRIEAAQQEVTFVVSAWGRGSAQAIAAEKRLTEAKQEEVDKRTALEVKATEDALREDDRRLQSGLKHIQSLYQQKQISAQQEKQAEIQLTQTILGEELKRLDTQLKDANLSAEVHQQLADRRKAIEEKLSDDIQAINDRTATQEEKVWTTYFNKFEQLTDQALRDVLTRHERFAKAAEQIFANLTLQVISDILKMAAEWAAFKVGLVATNPFGAGAGGLGGLIGGALGGGSSGSNAATQQLTAAITGNTLATTQNSGGIINWIEQGVQWIAQTLGLTTATAVDATATTAQTTATTGLIPAIATLDGALFDVQSLGLLPNTQALIANTAALQAAAASSSAGGAGGAAGGGFGLVGLIFNGLFAEGTDNVPATGLAIVHQGEMIIPPAASAAIRSGSGSFGAPPFTAARFAPPGGAAAAGASLNNTISVAALDAKSVVALFNSPQIMRQITANMQRYLAMNPSVRGTY